MMPHFNKKKSVLKTAMRAIPLFIFILSVSKMFAQVSEFALAENRNVLFPNTNLEFPKKHKRLVYKTNFDTLQLPFFDDFFQKNVYPDSNLWLDKWVYVNGHFALEPPTYGVATFDFFDEKGKPYKQLGSSGLYGADTLTSNFINLKDSFSKKYTPADSIVLSFFVQAKGLGFKRTAPDKLVLQVKDSSGNWANAWENSTLEGGPFQYVAIPIQAPSYLHKHFQFRFINFTPAWGNANQWHVDYILLDKNRTTRNIGFEDYAIQSMPTSLLKDYFSMPYSHFLSGENLLNDSTWFYVSNLSKVVRQFQVRHADSAIGLQLSQTNFNQNVTNCAAQSNSLRRFPMYDIGSFSEEMLTIQRRIEMQEDGIQNENRNNDILRVQQKFRNYFAYDDGSAEASFGFNDLSTGLGKIAVQFEMHRPDTLRGFSIFFNQELKDLSTAQIALAVWTKLDEGQENLLWERSQITPTYTDSINGYHYYDLDTFLSLPKGKFFIGWTQTDNFNLHVGFDKNGGNRYHKVLENQKIWSNIFGNWEKVNGLYGSPMIRAFVGSPYQPNASKIDRLKTDFSIFPNPSSDKIYFERTLVHIKLYDHTGRLVFSQKDRSNQITISKLSTGIYHLFAENLSNKGIYKKIIKL